jgi:predicted PurR-regulated permease PerM
MNRQATSAAAPPPGAPLARFPGALLVPLWIIAITSGVVFLRLARVLLVPFCLSLLAALVLSGGVEWLRRRGLPRAVSAALFLVFASIAITGAIQVAWSPAQRWLAEAPRVLHAIDERVRPARSALQRLDATFGPRPVSHGPPIAARAAPDSAPVSTTTVLTQTGSVLLSAVTVLVFTLFLLSAGPPTLARLAAAPARNLKAAHLLRVIEAIRVEVGRYYATLALINLGLGVCTAVTMQLLGMPNPLLWGILAAVLNFVPYLGSTATLLVLSAVASLTFRSATHILLVAGSYLALASIEGQIVAPILVGRRLNLNPIVVFVAVWVGGELWGIAGVVLALPILVAAKAAAFHSQQAHVIEEILGADEGALDAPPSATVTPLQRVARRQFARRPVAGSSATT